MTRLEKELWRNVFCQTSSRERPEKFVPLSVMLLGLLIAGVASYLLN